MRVAMDELQLQDLQNAEAAVPPKPPSARASSEAMWDGLTHEYHASGEDGAADGADAAGQQWDGEQGAHGGLEKERGNES